MTDIFGMLNALNRPKLLIRAARCGQVDYNRTRDLRRLLKVNTPPSPGAAIIGLIAVEEVQEEKRQNGDAGYSIARHVDLLIAMMGEAQLLRTRLSAAALPQTSPR
ncbi:DUF6477 family protein [Pseudogemmobacter sp. W21_MBD1_M6]|jgi:hypothetical protein|uniref:DUF6477 family protein n=1 Tax=Pseudogemmobacter sp. W21_MBD1_M6 TaxID=3240271 RepID=UPI003F96B148